jgi:hypothetical protein
LRRRMATIAAGIRAHPGSIAGADLIERLVG